MRRRESFVAIASLILSACGSSSSTPAAPTTTTTTTPPPTPQPKAQLVAATRNYTFELVVNETMSALDALTAVNLQPQTNSHTTTPGPLVTTLGGITGDWLLEHNSNWFVSDAGVEVLKPGDHLGCYKSR